MNDFEQYLKRYCKSYGYTMEEAREHALIKEVQKYYDEVEQVIVMIGAE